jgi:hypothetical protein
LQRHPPSISLTDAVRAFAGEQIAKSSFVGGVADEETPDEPPSDPDAPPKPDMRLMGNHALVNSTGGALRAMLLENAIEPGCWQVPVLYAPSRSHAHAPTLAAAPRDVRAVSLLACSRA